MAKQQKLTAIQLSITTNPTDSDLPIKLAESENKISQLQFEIREDLEVQMSEQEKSEYRLEGKTYTDRVNKLKTHCEQVYLLILGQCTQLLHDKMKQQSSWSTVSKSYNPLDLYTLLEKVILKQMDDQYPFSSVHKQLLAMPSNKQGN